MSRHIDKPNAIVSDEAECSRIYSVAELYMAAINDSLHSLTRLGVSLVHSSRISETTRARRALAGRRRNELLPYEAVSILVLETLYPQASDHLLRQFANSMMNRYIRHLYRASQQPSSVLSTTSSEAISTVSAMTKETDVPLGPPDSDVPKVDNQPKGSSPEGEPTTAMTQPVRASSDAIISVDSKAFYDGLNIPRPTNSRSPTSVARGNIFGPPLPTFDHLGKGDCEWCFKSIHQSMTDGRKWSLSGM